MGDSGTSGSCGVVVVVGVDGEVVRRIDDERLTSLSLSLSPPCWLVSGCDPFRGIRDVPARSLGCPLSCLCHLLMWSASLSVMACRVCGQVLSSVHCPRIARSSVPTNGLMLTRPESLVSSFIQTGGGQPVVDLLVDLCGEWSVCVCVCISRSHLIAHLLTFSTSISQPFF